MSLFNDIFAFFILIVAAVILAFVIMVAKKRYNDVVNYFGGPNALARLAPTEIYFRRSLKQALFLIAVFFIFLSLAGPQWGIETVRDEAKTAQAIIAVDVSYSMLTKDLQPNRLENAKHMFISLINQLEDYRLGVIAFSGEAMTQCPITTDVEALRYFVSVMQAGMLFKQGTSISSAIKLAAETLSKYPGQKALILLSDGEDRQPAEVDKALALAKDAGIRIIAVGIGTKDGQVLPDPFSSEYVKDSEGKIVISRLDEGMLNKIASQTHGAFIPYTTADDVSTKIYNELTNLDRTSSESRERSIYKNRYQIPLAIALILLLLELLIPERKMGKTKKMPPAAILLAALFIQPGFAQNFNSQLREGADSYNTQNYEEAIEHYTRALELNGSDIRAHFNLGNSYYKAEDYAKAAESYENVLQYANPNKDAKTIQDTLFNTGNAHYKNQELEKAIASYRSAILADPSDKEAKNNLQLALEKNKENCENPQENDEEKEQDKDQDKDDQQDKQDKKDNNKDQQDKDNKGNEKDDKDKEKDSDNKDKDNKDGKDKDDKSDPKDNKDDKDKKDGDKEKEEQPHPNALDKSTAERLMQMAKEQERQNAPKAQPLNQGGFGSQHDVDFDW